MPTVCECWRQGQASNLLLRMLKDKNAQFSDVVSPTNDKLDQDNISKTIILILSIINLPRGCKLSYIIVLSCAMERN